jgi:hypothetical protein
MVSYEDCPESRGRIWVVPEFEDASRLQLNIIGDPEGLQYLADSFAYLARFEQEAKGQPSGTRAHLHFYPKRPGVSLGELGAPSCPVHVWRADAAHTGEIWGELDRLQESADRFTRDETPPTEWLDYATSTLGFAREAFSRTGKVHQQAAGFSAHAIYCSIMAGLRAMEIPVPECTDYPAGILWFVPEGLVLPIDEYVLADKLNVDEMARPKRVGVPTPEEDEVAAALDAAEKLVMWAQERVRGS